jgi:hypothetical protein
VRTSVLKAVKDEEITKMTNKDRQRCGCFHRCCLGSPVAKLFTQSTSRRLWPSFWQFLRLKVPDFHPRTGFSTWATLQSTLPPQFRTSKRWQRHKEALLPALFTIYYPSRLALFLCPRVKSELAGIWLSHDSFKTSCDGVIQTIA